MNIGLMVIKTPRGWDTTAIAILHHSQGISPGMPSIFAPKLPGCFKSDAANIHPVAYQIRCLFKVRGETTG